MKDCIYLSDAVPSKMPKDMEAVAAVEAGEASVAVVLQNDESRRPSYADSKYAPR